MVCRNCCHKDENTYLCSVQGASVQECGLQPLPVQHSLPVDYPLLLPLPLQGSSHLCHFQQPAEGGWDFCGGDLRKEDSQGFSQGKQKYCCLLGSFISFMSHTMEKVAVVDCHRHELVRILCTKREVDN